MGDFTPEGLYKPDALEGGAAGLLNANWDLIDAFMAAGGGGGGSQQGPSYVIYQSAGTTYALNGNTGAIDYSSGSDPAAVVQSVLTALASTGGKLEMQTGDYNWNSVPKLPRNTTKWIHIVGEGNVKIILNSSSKRFLDFDRQAAGDTFNFFVIDNFTIDASASSGWTNRNHIVVGNYANGSTLAGQDVNYDRIVVRNIRTLGVRTTATGTAANYNIWLAVHATTASPQYHITNILVEKCEFNGGCYGVGIYGTRQSGGTGEPDIWMDNIIVRDVYHDSGVTPTAFDNFANVHLGSKAAGGRCWVERCTGKNSADVAIEIDNFMTAFATNNHIENQFGYGYAITNYHLPPDVNSQVYYISGTTARRDGGAWSGATSLIGVVVGSTSTIPVTAVALQSGTTYRFTTSTANPAVVGYNVTIAGFTPSGYNGVWLVTNVVDSTHFDAVLATNPAAVSVYGTAATNPPFGRVVVDKVLVYNKGMNIDTANMTGDLLELKAPMIEFSLNHAQYVCEGLSHTSGTNALKVIYTIPIAGPGGRATKLNISNVDIRITGTFGVGSSESDTTGLYLSGVLDLDVDNVNIYMDLVNAAALSERAADIGQAGSSTINGTIRRLSYTATGTPRGITVYDAATKLTIPANTDLRIVDCDFSGMAAGTEIAYADTTNKLKTYVRDIKWRVFPKASYAITAPASATGTQYGDTWDGTMFVHGGTVSLVEVSRENSTYYTVATATNCCFPIHHGEWYRITYTGTPAIHIFANN